MGTTASGVLFSNTVKTEEAKGLLSLIVGEEVTPFDSKSSGQFDTRKASDIGISVIDGHTHIDYFVVAQAVLQDSSYDVTPLYDAFGKPSTMLFYVSMDSGDSYGYALFKDGVRVRSRSQFASAPGPKFGEPSEYEKRWLNAPYKLEDDEKIYSLQNQEGKVEFLYEGEIEQNFLTNIFLETFGYCPWETDKQASYGGAFRTKSVNVGPLYSAEEAMERVRANKAELTKWSWGAFWLNVIWAVRFRVWFGLLFLIPGIGLFVAILLGFNGREQAWKNGDWRGVSHFIEVQRKWDRWGWIFFFAVAAFTILARAIFGLS